MSRQKLPKYVRIKELLDTMFIESGYRPGQKLPTEHELMKEYGASRTTVRQALSLLEENGVLEKKHGSGTYYRGRDRARQDATGKGLIGLLNFFNMDYIYADIVRGIQETVEEAGYNLVLANCDRDVERELINIRSLIAQGIQGVIIEPSQTMEMNERHPLIEEVYASGIPMVATHWGFSCDQISTVTLDDERAACNGVRFLIGRGLSRIAMIYVDDVQTGRLRYDGYRKALAEAGLKIVPGNVISYSARDEMETPDLGYILTTRLLKQRIDTKELLPDAVFYFNDRLAWQGCQAIKDLGLRIPEDISVLGFDNHKSSSLLKPALATLNHPKYELGKWAAQLLMDEIEGGNRIPKKLVFEAPVIDRLSVRSCSAKPPGNH